MKILGIDETGRGAVVGPMIICGALIDEKNLQKLKDLNIRDSKELSPSQREYLDKKLREVLEDFLILDIPAKKIDELRPTKNLNRIELENFAKVIKTLKPDKAIIDGTEVNTEKIKNDILKELGGFKPDIIVENYADRKYPIVGAASILAKVVRDKSIGELEKKTGKTIGKGYPSDERTIKFLKDLLKEKKDFPDFVRKSWATSLRLKEKKNQRKLTDF